MKVYKSCPPWRFWSPYSGLTGGLICGLILFTVVTPLVILGYFGLAISILVISLVLAIFTVIWVEIKTYLKD